MRLRRSGICTGVSLVMAKCINLGGKTTLAANERRSLAVAALLCSVEFDQYGFYRAVELVVGSVRADVTGGVGADFEAVHGHCGNQAGRFGGGDVLVIQL